MEVTRWVELQGLHELQRDYSIHKPKPNLFSLEQPYSSRAECAPGPGAAHADAPPAGAPANVLNPTDDLPGNQVSTRSAPRQRKKRKRDPVETEVEDCTLGDADKEISLRELRHREAEARHRSILPVLVRAHKQFLDARGGRVASCASGWSEEAPQELDLVSLRGMAAVLRPQLCWQRTHPAGAGEPSALRDGNLFDRLLENPCNEDRLASAMDTSFVLPPRSRVLMSDMHALRRQTKMLKQAPASTATATEWDNGGFHVILMDPPWENASARRGQKYSTVPSRNFLTLPIVELCHSQGALVAVWITNRERHLRFAMDELFPAWNVDLVATWYWLKVTDTGDLVTPLDAPNRRPYERLLIARTRNSCAQPTSTPCSSRGESHEEIGKDSQLNTHSTCAEVPNDLVMISTPGAHSRKPKLKGLLEQYQPEGARCLELFAREATSGWTSWGNEVLKFQHSSYFQSVSC
mmetsp:Transcript_45887/g.87585  ORF Transcript_45887/g.87585 Transcript_45887/m.87585 type:complete len:466 (+) Transcript_45887:158-1555(+)